jgi:hypothetical protein
LLVKDKNTLKFFTEENQAIIFDDMNFDNFSEEEKLNLLDKTKDSEIRIVFDRKKIPNKVIKAISTNNISKIIPYRFDTYDGNKYLTKTFNRRVTKIEIVEPLFNININLRF